MPKKLSFLIFPVLLLLFLLWELQYLAQAYLLELEISGYSLGESTWTQHQDLSDLLSFFLILLILIYEAWFHSFLFYARFFHKQLRPFIKSWGNSTWLVLTIVWVFVQTYLVCFYLLNTIDPTTFEAMLKYSYIQSFAGVIGFLAIGIQWRLQKFVLSAAN